MIETPDIEPYRVIISIPTLDHVPYQFAIDLANMVGWSNAAIGDKVAIATNIVANTYIHKGRQQLLDEALKLGGHYVLWLDSDMRFPKDLLIRLLAHDKEMVGINYSTRGIPPRFVAIKRVGIDDENNEGYACATYPDSTGLEEVEAVGFGAVLMKMVVTQTLPENEPWFWYGYNDAGRTHVGEDVWFCRLVRKGGWKIYVDHDLSKECRHMGQMEFALEHAQKMLEDRQEEEPDVDHLVYRVADSGGELAEQE
jgi:hypothetical protein